MTRVGINQLRLLIMTASPTCILVTTDRCSDALVRRGLLREDEGRGKGCCITPAGLRALADEMDAGRVKDAIEAMRKEMAERQAKRDERRAKRGTA